MPRTPQNDAKYLTRKKADPERQCAVTRERRPQSGLLRFACDPDGQVVPDIGGKLPGRGAWILPSRTCLDTAIARGTFKRAFARDVQGLEALGTLTEARLLAHCQGILGMAKRAGHIILGFDQVRAALRKARPGLLLEAADGARDGRNKVHSLAKALYSQVHVSGGLTSHELGMAFGRAHVIHGLLKRGPFAERWQLDYARLTGFRVAPEDNWFSVTARQDERSAMDVDPEKFGIGG